MSRVSKTISHTKKVSGIIVLVIPLTPDVYALLEAEAKKQGISSSYLGREIIQRYLWELSIERDLSNKIDQMLEELRKLHEMIKNVDLNGKEKIESQEEPQHGVPDWIRDNPWGEILRRKGGS